MRMKNYLLIAMLLIYGLLAAEIPDWTVNSNDYEFTMTLSGVAVIDQIETRNANDKIAAWVNGELRGVANSFHVANTDRYYFFCLVYSNANNEEVSFRYYDAEKDSILSLVNIESFVIDLNKGSFTEPVIFLDSLKYDFESFEFLNVENQDVMVDTANRHIAIIISDNSPRDSLIAGFSFSNALSVSVNGVEQESGITANDFTNDVIYTIQTDTGKIEWVVSVELVLEITDLLENAQVDVYPNPSTGRLFLSSDLILEEVYLTDIRGVRQDVPFIGRNEIDISSLRRGIYFLNFRNGESWIVTKIIKND